VAVIGRPAEGLPLSNRLNETQLVEVHGDI
jgi:hypothetical protein